MAGVLTGIGARSVATASDDSQYLFAAIPLGFAAQQAIEGTVWLRITSPSDHLLLRAAVFSFLAFALVIWPMWVPLSLRLLERDDARRRWLGWLTAVGVVVAAVAVWLLVWWEPHARVDGHSLRYSFGGHTNTAVHVALIVAYVIPTLLPFFVSTEDLSKVFGTALIVAMGITVLIRREALTSVWCFFAAGLSVVVLVSIRRRTRATDCLPGARARP